MTEDGVDMAEKRNGTLILHTQTINGFKAYMEPKSLIHEIKTTQCK